MYSLLDGSGSYGGNRFFNRFLDLFFWHVRHFSMHFVQEFA